MSSEFIHDPDGIVLFEEATEVEVSSGGVSSTATIRVLPFSARRDERTFWAGPDTYRVPEDAEYVILENLSGAKDEIGPLAEDDESVSLATVVDTAEG